MSDLVWRPMGAAALNIDPEEALSMNRVLAWIITRAISQAIVEVAADRDEPLRVCLVVGTQPVVEFAKVHIRRESPKESPS